MSKKQTFKSLGALKADYDVVVVGAGAAGLASALFAALKGARTLLVEREQVIGGTTAYSGGTAWIPCTHHSQGDTIADARTFLQEVVGNGFRADVIDGFLESGPVALRTLEDKSEVKFRPYATHPDYEQEASGAVLRGRALMPEPFDAGKLGSALSFVRKPIPEMTIFGGLMLDANDIKHFLNAFKNVGSFSHSARRMTRHWKDLAVRGRSTHMTNGNALVGRFIASLQSHANVDIVLGTRPLDLHALESGGWTLELSDGNGTRSVTAKNALVMAGGGFTRNPEMRAKLLPEAEIHSPSAPGATGEMQNLALKAGAHLGDTDRENAFWAPVSIRRRKDGSQAVYPHFLLDRSKPRSLCVDQTGRRFVNEATSYHRFARAMLSRAEAAVPAYFIMDAVAIRKYGMGVIKPGTGNLQPYIDDGYLVKADSIEALAGKLGVDAHALADTIERMNEYASTGIDEEFGKGSTAYHRHNGDASVGPNPCLGPIEAAPFYAIRLYPGDIGASTGIVTDAWARVIDGAGRPIPGLFACGNEADSMMAGTYPGPGITIGPAIVFAYRAIECALGADGQSLQHEQSGAQAGV